MDQNPYRAPLFDEHCLTAGVGKSSACYRSTPEHLRSFVGRFLYIYTDKGELHLTADSLTFSAKSGSLLTIALDSISSIRIGHYPRWAKPIRLDFIEVRHRQGEVETAVLLTPTRSWMTSVWETNGLVAEWAQSLEASRQNATSWRNAAS